MKKALALTLALYGLIVVCCGCGSLPVKVVYLDKPAKIKRVICMEKEAIPSACGKFIKDDGSSLKLSSIQKFDEYGRALPVQIEVEQASACYFPDTETIVVPMKACPSPLFWHEYCHAMRLTPLECHTQFPAGSN
jgi:hypothetical protein